MAAPQAFVAATPLLRLRRVSPCATSPARRARAPPRSLLETTVHTLPDLAQQLLVSCGVGLAGLVGAKATEQARAFVAGDRRAEALRAISADLDSQRRRAELASNPGDRDWTDMRVDKLANRVVVQAQVPSLPQADELDRFDSLLGVVDNDQVDGLPPVADFLLDDDNDFLARDKEDHTT